MLAPRNVNTAALRSCEDTMTEAPVGARPSRTAQRVEMPSDSSRASTVSARASLPSFTSALTSSPSRDMPTAELTAPPPVWVETSAASVLLPSFSSRKEESALSMLMRSMRSLAMIAIVSMVAPPTVRLFMAQPCAIDWLLTPARRNMPSERGSQLSDVNAWGAVPVRARST